jgi:hypothetical protein
MRAASLVYVLHTLADIPDQSQIVRQYMRYTAELYSAATIPRVIHRGLQL